jgi:hypothetical protein
MKVNVILDGQICHKRIEQAYAQGQLFDPVQPKQEQMSLEVAL